MSNLVKRILSSIVLIPLALYFIFYGSYMLMFFILICFVIACYEWHKIANNKPYKNYGFFFLIISFYTFYELSADRNGFLFVLIICISTDIGGYVFGKFFNGPKLTKISPNKTYAGAIGGYFLSSISLIFFINYIDYPNQLSSELILILILISSVSQFGDITVSFFKRKSKIKNTGNIIPGHGGLLDRVDGMIFAFPIYYLINLTGYLKI
tara:strand:- start:1223 stop:1852 length:630 start_codon:yes stop_codon:yes gene_type:complete